MISVMIENEFGWKWITKRISQILDVEGKTVDLDICRRHGWHLMKCVSLVAIDEPDYDDDFGLPLSKFNVQIMIDCYDSQLSEAIGRFIAFQLWRTGLGEPLVLRDLSVEIPYQ